MNLNEFNSLTDLFFYQAEKQNPESVFLEWLNPKNKKKFTWGETSANIHKLAKVLKENIVDGDRCLLVSENRPEWLIAENSPITIIAIAAATPARTPNFLLNEKLNGTLLFEYELLGAGFGCNSILVSDCW